MKNKEILELEEKIKRHREHTKVRGELFRENQRAIFREFKLKYENSTSIVDYILGLFRQFLALSVTGYLGLLVVPPNTLGNTSKAQGILLFISFFSFTFIISSLIVKFLLSKEIDSLINTRMGIHHNLLKIEDECEVFTQKQLDEIIALKNKITE